MGRSVAILCIFNVEDFQEMQKKKLSNFLVKEQRENKL